LRYNSPGKVKAARIKGCGGDQEKDEESVSRGTAHDGTLESPHRQYFGYPGTVLSKTRGEPPDVGCCRSFQNLVSALIFYIDRHKDQG
jgi:hypothetical protein